MILPATFFCSRSEIKFVQVLITGSKLYILFFFYYSDNLDKSHLHCLTACKRKRTCSRTHNLRESDNIWKQNVR